MPVGSVVGPVRGYVVLSFGTGAVLARDLRGLAWSEGKQRHPGLPDAPKRSNLAYANEHRPWQLYRSVFYQLLTRCREVAGSHGFRFKNKLLTLDAALIELCASVFDWAQYRRTKGAVTLHLFLDHQGLLPSFALITEGRVHESRVARSLGFEPGTIVVFDRGYADYSGSIASVIPKLQGAWGCSDLSRLAFKQTLRIMRLLKKGQLTDVP